MTTQGLTTEEQARLIVLLQKIESPVPPLDTPLRILNPVPPLDTGLYLALARLLPQLTIELVPLIAGPNGEAKVLLFKRGVGAAIYAGHWHFPGTMIRAGDETLKSAFERIAAEMNVSGVSPKFVGHLWRPDTRRGPILSMIFVYSVTVGQRWICAGQWFDVTALPNPMIEDHEEMIDMAVQFLELGDD